MHVGQWHPEPGETVGVYEVVELLGAGGLGVVFKVKRAGRYFAIKFLAVPRLDGRTKREISILNRLNNPSVVGYVGSDFWPNPTTGHPFIVMEYVPGDTLEDFALKRNPSARKIARIILDVARTLGEVHAEGVFHRDLKPSNIIIRGVQEQPVLIDFGIASLVGATCLTGSRLPPGTEEFRAPEPLRFERANPNGADRYEFGVTDELWALGVALYWLLTNLLPFGERSVRGGVDALHERILSQRPRAPHVVNPRVPLALSHLCMKMLAEWPPDRFPNVPELCAALQEALQKADDDPAWDEPLIDPYAPQLTTTVEDPALREPNEVLRAFRQSGKRRPRRGQVPPNAAPDVPPSLVQVEHAGPPAMDADRERLPTVDASRDAAPLGEREPPVTSAREPPGGSPLAPGLAAHPRRSRWLVGLVAVLVAVATVAVAVRLEFWRLGSATKNATGVVGSKPPPRELLVSPSTGRGVRGPEVAFPWEPSQSLSQVGAVPVWAQPPTPAVNAMSTQTTKNESPKSQKQRAGLRLPLKSVPVAAAIVATCTGAGCTAGNSQVRSEPPQLTCPEGWEETHKKFNIGRGTVALVGTTGEWGETSRIYEGRATAKVDNSALGLPRGALLLGTWRFGEDRLFATFTQAQIPGEGTLPVCLVSGEDSPSSMGIVNGNEVICPPGLGTCPAPGSERGSVKSYDRVRLYRASWRF